MPSKHGLHYTFGNHMHWVDMEWLWGYHVLPGSIRDMLEFCRQTGARGCVNFDGVGYEKLAVEAPDALAELRTAVESGIIEVVGGSYGQPYGLFHGGESNVRQRVYGVRAVLRQLGVRVNTFWEEEFDFFPQLPQMLRGVGMEHASLFFQWTWHTPHVPWEDSPVVQWRGIDGSTLIAASRNRLNLHQWPEDLEALLNDLAERPPAERGAPPLVLQWLELMPSADWMCRSEVLLPNMRKFLADDRFDVRFCTLGEYLSAVDGADLPVRSYTMDDVWHGMSLGKNGDRMRSKSSNAEAALLQTESLHALLGLFGRPYASWDVYPTWELEEAWRALLVAQHHDNCECEGLCGHVGRSEYDRAEGLAYDAWERAKEALCGRISAEEGSIIAYNPLGWPVSGLVPVETDREVWVSEVPAFGYAVIRDETYDSPAWRDEGLEAACAAGACEARVDLATGRLTQLRTREFPDGILDPEQPLFDLTMTVGGKPLHLSRGPFESSVEGDTLQLVKFAEECSLFLDYRLNPVLGALDVGVLIYGLPRPDGGMNAGLQHRFRTRPAPQKILVDQPYSVTQVSPQGEQVRKYPTGDWMTSPQWFEKIARPFTALSFVDLLMEDGSGLLVCHDASPQWFADDGSVRNLLTMYDPWDEDYFDNTVSTRFRLLPHGPITNANRWRIAQEHRRPLWSFAKKDSEGDLPQTFETISCDAPNARITAFYRETVEGGRGIEGYAGREMAENPHPYVLRIVEFDGSRANVKLRIARTVARAFKTNLLGQKESELMASIDGKRSTISFEMRPFEIATLYLDIVEGRKQARDLDAHRNIWAGVHRT